MDTYEDSDFFVTELNATITSRRFEVEGLDGAADAQNGDSGVAVVTEDNCVIGIIQAVLSSGTALILPWQAVEAGSGALPHPVSEVTFSLYVPRVFEGGFFLQRRVFPSVRNKHLFPNMPNWEYLTGCFYFLWGHSTLQAMGTFFINSRSCVTEWTPKECRRPRNDT